MPGCCRGYGCTSTDLIKAHIIPQSFGRWVQGDSGRNVMLSDDGWSAKTPRGLFDIGILCAKCDGHLNKRYDDPAFRFFKGFDLSATRIIDPNPTPYHKAPLFFEASGIDCEMLCGFILSVLWRSSISSRPELSTVSLGPYEDRAQEVLWGIRRLSSFTEFEVTFQRYRSQQVEIEKTYSLPARTVDPLHIYAFACLGFRFQAKIGRQALPRFFNGFVLGKSPVVRGLIIDFEETREARQLCEMAHTATARRNAGQRQSQRT